MIRDAESFGLLTQTIERIKQGLNEQLTLDGVFSRVTWLPQDPRPKSKQFDTDFRSLRWLPFNVFRHDERKAETGHRTPRVLTKRSRSGSSTCCITATHVNSFETEPGRNSVADASTGIFCSISW